MTPRGPTLEQIKAAANARAEDVLRWCNTPLDAGDWGRLNRGRSVLISNPRRKDVHPSFVIFVKNGTLAFKDMAGYCQGDVIDFVSWMQGFWHLKNRGCHEALMFLADRLGIRQMSEAERNTAAAKSRAFAAGEQKKSAEKLARDQSTARRLWLDFENLYGTIGERYLHHRGLDPAALPLGPRGGDRRPRILRFHSRMPHIWNEKGSPRNGEVTYWPCIVAGCVDPATGEMGAIHRTWLRPDGLGKAPVVPPRKTWPDYRGLVIPIWRGESGLSVREARAAGLRETFQMGEGWETAWSMVMGAPEFRTWAFISLSNLQNIVLPEICDGVILSRENDWTKPAAVAAFEAGKRALERQGRPVVEAASPIGKDFNNALMGAA